MGLAGQDGCRVALREGPLMLGCEQGLCKCEPGVLHRAPAAHQSHAVALALSRNGPRRTRAEQLGQLGACCARQDVHAREVRMRTNTGYWTERSSLPRGE